MFNKCINKTGRTAEETREGKKKYKTSQIKQPLQRRFEFEEREVEKTEWATTCFHMKRRVCC